ncbi:spermidine/putrescine ABC transporter ATP-binding protein [Bradyrhizobium sacchari]|uniref:Spermidine/putrescine import ATP-binding protein PotA n=1 Tax=Bradyrhizobium sacchari TaxID=1399419 RepID=A0A560JNU5_9BRAD|nr:ABC transporter ATP-binding protein [Bradyrhizobium sacchari]OPY98344.1 spermidine/putrescine ABC transporter ATP-binding protein [Bradyrhizobium sacchari]TWB56857.1 putative spermidine/putrescine transport system ATP-binding protein [Bradyrhizobium sacchari]TWB71134.1 putative spermidine/putrescine transport system ATP-binding protein [Bradyrhizobium sacchari]
MSASIEIAGVSKVYDGGVRAVDAVAMDIRQGEFFSLLGPSGCGKTTTLRMIAGFETPSSGAIRVDGADITHVPAHKRDMGMVFQNYALFPHRTVAENVAFGLRMRGLDKATITAKVKAALAMVELSGLEDRRPAQLSGGQQQRVALARAIVIAPRVLLCDEPLGALDKKLRQQMQFELKQLQKKLGLTLVFVTHDQEEALAMSDRIAVMNGGRVEQVGTPTEIYNQPTTRFVADFIGDTNIFRGERTTTSTVASALDVGKGLILALPPTEGQGTGVLSVALRPEKIRLITRTDAATAAGSSAHGIVENTNFLGGAVLYRVTLESAHRVLVQQPNAGTSRLFVPGDGVTLEWTPADLVVLKD